MIISIKYASLRAVVSPCFWYHVKTKLAVTKYGLRHVSDERFLSCMIRRLRSYRISMAALQLIFHGRSGISHIFVPRNIFLLSATSYCMETLRDLSVQIAKKYGGKMQLENNLVQEKEMASSCSHTSMRYTLASCLNNPIA